MSYINFITFYFSLSRFANWQDCINQLNWISKTYQAVCQELCPKRGVVIPACTVIFQRDTPWSFSVPCEAIYIIENANIKYLLPVRKKEMAPICTAKMSETSSFFGTGQICPPTPCGFCKNPPQKMTGCILLECIVDTANSPPCRPNVLDLLVSRTGITTMIAERRWPLKVDSTQTKILSFPSFSMSRAKHVKSPK